MASKAREIVLEAYGQYRGVAVGSVMNVPCVGRAIGAVLCCRLGRGLGLRLERPVMRKSGSDEK